MTVYVTVVFKPRKSRVEITMVNYLGIFITLDPDISTIIKMAQLAKRVRKYTPGKFCETDPCFIGYYFIN
jgi:hypothetical protein